MKYVNINEHDKELLDEPDRKLIDKLLYLMTLNQFMTFLKKSHYEVALRIVRYVKKTQGQRIFMKSQNKEQLIGLSDSDWGGCIESRRFFSGYIIKLGESIIKSKLASNCDSLIC